MTPFEMEVKRKLEDASSAPCDCLRDKILADAQDGHEPFRNRRKVSYAAALITAVAVVLSVTTAVAYGGDLFERVRIIFGNSTAERVEIIHDDPSVKLTYRLYNQSPEFNLWPYFSGYAVLSSIDEARSVVPFDFREPGFLPEYLELDGATVQFTEDRRYFYSVSFNFSGGYRHLFVLQQKIGDRAHISLQSVDGIESVILGEVEALGISIDGNIVDLIFISDGIFYQVSGWLAPGDLIAVAESLLDIYR